MAGLWETLEQLVTNLGTLFVELLQFALHWALIIAWLAWWLWGVNWKKVWPVLGRGGWAPVVLLMVVSALVWAQIQPSECACLGFVTVPNFWWQLGSVGLLVAITLMCGWLQEVLGWTPAEVELEPPVTATGHEHAHH
jgi:hypothetical protein